MSLPDRMPRAPSLQDRILPGAISPALLGIPLWLLLGPGPQSFMAIGAAFGGIVSRNLGFLAFRSRRETLLVALAGFLGGIFGVAAYSAFRFFFA